MEFKGTKGEWVQNGENGIHTWQGRCIALTYNENCRANALLISKAPEMLEMLKALVNGYELIDLGETSVVLEAKKLIKSATEITE